MSSNSVFWRHWQLGCNIPIVGRLSAHNKRGRTDFPGSPVVKTSASTSGDTGLIPSSGKILCAVDKKKKKAKGKNL